LICTNIKITDGIIEIENTNVRKLSAKELRKIFRYSYYHYIRKPEKREKKIKFPKDLAKSRISE